MTPRATRAGLMCALGVCSGTVFWVTASLAGLSAVIAARPSVQGALQLIGRLFLIYMGVSSVRSGFASRRAPTVVVGTEEYTEQAIAAGSINDMTGWRAYKLGVVTNLSNPKALVFFGAVFAQFIRPDMSPTWTVAVAAIRVAMPVAWFSTFALIVRAASRWIAHHFATIDIVSGFIFAVLGLVMAVKGAIELFG